MMVSGRRITIDWLHEVHGLSDSLDRTTVTLRQAQQHHRQGLASGGARHGTAAAAVLAPPHFGCLVPGGGVVRVPAVCAHTTFESLSARLLRQPRRDCPPFPPSCSGTPPHLAPAARSVARPLRKVTV